MKRLTRRGQMLEPLRAAEGHAPHPGTVLNEVHGEMPSAAANHAWRLGQLHGRRAEHRPPVGLAKGREFFHLLDRLEREPGERGLAVDRELGQPQRRGHPRCHLRTEPLTKRIDLGIFDPETSRRRVAATGDEQIPAGDERSMHVKPRHTPHTADCRPALVLVAGDHHNRPMKPLGEPASHDPDHAGMPAAVGQHEGRIALGIKLLLRLLRGRKLDAPLLVLALGVELVNVFGEGYCAGRFGCGQEFDPAGCLAEPSSRVEAGCEPKRDVLTLEL